MASVDDFSICCRRYTVPCVKAGLAASGQLEPRAERRQGGGRRAAGAVTHGPRAWRLLLCDGSRPPHPWRPRRRSLCQHFPAIHGRDMTICTFSIASPVTYPHIIINPNNVTGRRVDHRTGSPLSSLSGLPADLQARETRQPFPRITQSTPPAQVGPGPGSLAISVPGPAERVSIIRSAPRARYRFLMRGGPKIDAAGRRQDWRMSLKLTAHGAVVNLKLNEPG